MVRGTAKPKQNKKEKESLKNLYIWRARSMAQVAKHLLSKYKP
jgi:hypothetical protein